MGVVVSYSHSNQMLSTTLLILFLPTAILNPKAPKEPAKTFSFDYSYWSHTTVSFNIVSVPVSSIMTNKKYKI